MAVAGPEGLEELATALARAGLIEVFVDDQGKEVYIPTAEGFRVGTMLAMAQRDDAEAVLESLLGAPETRSA
jgi:hypothetical protein